MPCHGTRGMGLIAEAGESPQSKLCGSKSTRSNIKEKSSDSDLESLFYVTTYSKFTAKSGEQYCYIYLKTYINPINLSMI